LLWFPTPIRKDATLSAGARLLWVVLGEYQSMSVDCFPSQEILAAQLGVKVRQLQTFCKELENYTRGDPPEPCPLIEVKRAGAGKERKTRKIYNLLRQPFVAIRTWLCGGTMPAKPLTAMPGSKAGTAASAMRAVLYSLGL
jgi:hypothetical protein